MKRKGLPFWGALAILLTTLSPKLNAAIVSDILPLPYEVVSPSLLSVEPIAAPLDWSGSLVDFKSLTPQGLENNTTGTLALTLEGSPVAVEQFIGEILPTREFTLVTSLGSSLVALDGIFTAGYDRALGRVYSLDSSEVTGIFELQAVDLPPAGLLFIGAMGTMMVLARKKAN